MPRTDLPTNSALERAAACPMSTVLPVISETSSYAEDGTVFHAFLEDVVKTPGGSLEERRAAALEAAPEPYRAALALIPVEALQLDPAKIAVEVAFAYDIATGEARELGRGIGRAYGELKPTEYAGTTDRLALVDADGLYVGDYKRGWSKRTPAAKNLQLRKCALDACRTYGREWADVEIVRLGDDGETYHDKARLSAFDLDAFALELEDLHARIQADRAAYAAGELPRAEVGDHCRYCPSLRYCPAKATLARAVLGGDSVELAKLSAGEALITPDNAPRLWMLIDQAEKVLDLVKTALKDFARQTPIELPDGRRVGPVPVTTREITDGARARAVLEEMLNRDAANAGVEVRLTLAGLTKAIRAWIQMNPRENIRGALGRKEEEVFERLKSAGLAQVTELVQIRAAKPPAPKKAAKNGAADLGLVIGG